MLNHTKQVRLSSDARQSMFRLWRKGYTFAEIAQKYSTYRQKPRAVVLSFKPSFEDFRCHDHFRRLNQFQSPRGGSDS